MDDATPRPWVEREGYIFHTERYRTVPVRPQQRESATDPGGSHHDEAVANAAMIVRAVNNHADLVKALQWFLNDIRFQVSIGGNPIVVDRMLREASEILTKACLPSTT